VTQESFELLQLWVRAISDGRAAPADWTAWAIDEVSRSDRPDSWICCIATATTREAALGELHAAMRREGQRWLDGLALSLGQLYARYTRGELTLEELSVQIVRTRVTPRARRTMCC
jgi:hypothetical protein